MARDRPGSKRLSFHRRSTSSVPRVEAFETPEEKHKMQVKGKADPSRAMVEAEPIAVANSEVTMGRPLRDMEHRDQDGNVIVDPDRSNPTRPRLERPLDTIRSFEAAIDGSYHRRQSYRTETPNASTVAQTRRTSYMSSHQPLQQRRGPSEGVGHYNDRPYQNRPDSYHENGNNTPGSYAGNSTNRRLPPRNNSDPALYGNNQVNNPPQQNFYPSHGHQQSYDTVGGVSNGSHVTEPWGNSTDPSSENSSIDRVHPLPKPDPGETYGFNGFGGNPQLSGPILEEYGHDDSATHGYPQQDQYYSNMDSGQQYQSHGPPVPQHAGGAPLPPPKEIRTGMKPNEPGYGSRSGGFNAPTRPQQPDKRKSWLKRFSKS